MELTRGFCIRALASKALPTIAEAIAEGARRLEAARINEARRTSSLLLGHALKLDRAALIINSNQPIDETSYRAFLQLIDRRAGGEPSQYIRGYQEFYGLDFAVTPDVLVPRPETELLVEAVIELARAESQDDRYSPLIVDVGTGSGCIAVTLALNIPRARLLAIDISPAALRIAEANAARHRVAERIEFLEGDLLAPLARDVEADFLVSNPPYVPAKDRESLQREVRDWEPAAALFGGEQGLDFYRRLITDGRRAVKRGGYMVCEIGYNQLDMIRAMIDAASWEMVRAVSDLQAIPRTIILRRV